MSPRDFTKFDWPLRGVRGCIAVHCKKVLYAVHTGHHNVVVWTGIATQHSPAAPGVKEPKGRGKRIKINLAAKPKMHHI